MLAILGPGDEYLYPPIILDGKLGSFPSYRWCPLKTGSFGSLV